MPACLAIVLILASPVETNQIMVVKLPVAAFGEEPMVLLVTAAGTDIPVYSAPICAKDDPAIMSAAIKAATMSFLIIPSPYKVGGE